MTGRATETEREMRRQRTAILVLTLVCVAGSILWLSGIGRAGDFAAITGGLAVGSSLVYLAALFARGGERWFWVVLALVVVIGCIGTTVFLDPSVTEVLDMFVWGVFFAVLMFSLRRIVYGGDT